jgi:uncharacterized cupin superfamily protein
MFFILKGRAIMTIDGVESMLKAGAGYSDQSRSKALHQQ